MHVRLPDPHPGRCENLRADRGRIGHYRRCLEAEGTQHVCRFPPSTKQERFVSYTALPKPTPWVVPPA